MQKFESWMIAGDQWAYVPYENKDAMVMWKDVKDMRWVYNENDDKYDLMVTLVLEESSLDVNAGVLTHCPTSYMKLIHLARQLPSGSDSETLVAGRGNGMTIAKKSKPTVKDNAAKQKPRKNHRMHAIREPEEVDSSVPLAANPTKSVYTIDDRQEKLAKRHTLLTTAIQEDMEIATIVKQMWAGVRAEKWGDFIGLQYLALRNCSG